MCVHVSPAVATLIQLCVCVPALRWFLFPSMHTRGPGQAPATNFDPPRIPNCTTSATLLLAVWDGVYRCTPPKTCLALCEHSPLFASLCHSFPRPRCALPYTLCVVQGHAHERRQSDNVSKIMLKMTHALGMSCFARAILQLHKHYVTVAQTILLTPLAGVRHTLLCADNSVCLSAKLVRHMG